MQKRDSRVIRMGFEDHDQAIAQAKVPPIFINDIDLRQKEEQERFRSLIYSSYSDNILSPIATCAMGCTVGQDKAGHLCSECGTMVEVPVDREPETILWMRAPEGVDAFMSPRFYILLNAALKLPAFSAMQWLMDQNYKPKKQLNRPPGIYLFCGGTVGDFNRITKNIMGEWDTLKLAGKNVSLEFLKEEEDEEEELDEEQEDAKKQLKAIEDEEDAAGGEYEPTEEEVRLRKLSQRPPKKPTAIHTTDPELINALSRWQGPQRAIQVWHFVNGEWVLKRNATSKVEKFLDLKIPRGLNYFRRNYRQVLETLLDAGILSSRNPSHRALLELIDKTEDRFIWSQHLPVPNRLCLVVEERQAGPRSDASTVDMVNACGSIADIDRMVIPLSETRRESRVAGVIRQLAEYYEEFEYKHLRPDSGWFRGNVFGTSMGYSLRSVITSIVEPHHWEEIHTPWAGTIRMLSEHIANRLQRRGYRPDDIHDIIADATNPISKEEMGETWTLMRSVLDELFEMARCIPGTNIKAIPVVDIRYPSLYRGSIQLLWISKVLDDPRENVTRMPIPCLPAYNADFDGDELSLMLVQDDKQLAYFLRLSPHLYSIETSKPRRASGNLKLPSPTMTTIANYLHSNRERRRI